MRQENKTEIEKALASLRGIVDGLADDRDGAGRFDCDNVLRAADPHIVRLRGEAGGHAYIGEKLMVLRGHLEGVFGRGGYRTHSSTQNVVWCMQALDALKMYQGFGHILEEKDSRGEGE